MADRSKIRWSQLKVGVVGLAGFAILAGLIFLLTSSHGLFEDYAQLRTYMDDASGVGDGTTVRLNGIAVGYLNKLQLTNSRNPKRTVEFDMKIQKKFLQEIPVDSMAGIGAANLLGDKFINITKGVNAQHIQDGAELQSLQTQDIPELMGQMGTVLTSFQTIVGRVDSLLATVEAGHGNLGLFLKDEELYKRVNGIAIEGQKLLADVRNSHGTLNKLIYDDELYKDIQAPLKRIDTMLASLQSGQGTAGMLLTDKTLFNDAHQTIQDIHSLLAELNAGKGTVGQLLKNDRLAKQVDDLIAKLTGTLDKINSGQGSLGQFVVNPQLYDSLSGATREFQSLAKDMRANPKKFLTIRLTLF